MAVWLGWLGGVRALLAAYGAACANVRLEWGRQLSE